jgi:hypothetical protein
MAKWWRSSKRRRPGCRTKPFPDVHTGFSLKYCGKRCVLWDFEKEPTSAGVVGLSIKSEPLTDRPSSKPSEVINDLVRIESQMILESHCHVRLLTEIPELNTSAAYE